MIAKKKKKYQVGGPIVPETAATPSPQVDYRDDLPMYSGAVQMRPDMLMDALLLAKELPGLAASMGPSFKRTIQSGLKALKGKGSIPDPEPMTDLIRIGGDPEKLKRMQQAFGGGTSMSDAQRNAIAASYRRKYPEFFE